MGQFFVAAALRALRALWHRRVRGLLAVRVAAGGLLLRSRLLAFCGGMLLCLVGRLIRFRCLLLFNSGDVLIGCMFVTRYIAIGAFATGATRCGSLFIDRNDQPLVRAD